MVLPLDEHNIPPMAPAAAMLDANRLPSDDLLYGSAAAMRAIREMVDRVANTKIHILIAGESGTGKEVLACRLHAGSAWRNGPFIKINCSILPGAPAEAELFNFGQSLATGGLVRPGILEVARGGTLFLDEVGDLPNSLQPKVLQLLQDGGSSEALGEGVGDTAPRIICATSRDLQQEIGAGNFRAELYYRLNGVLIEMPSLRDRIEDVPRLVDYYLGNFADRFGRPAQPLSASLMRQLQTYSWPGNIRQLENLIRRYVILGSPEVFEAEMRRREPANYLNFWLDTQGDGSLKQTTRRAVQRIERLAIAQALQASNWNRKRAAKSLKISYRALLYKIKESGIVASDAAADAGAPRLENGSSAASPKGNVHGLEQ